MARGKHGVAAAARRAEEAEAEVARLRNELSLAVSGAAERERELKTELQQLQGRFSKAVKETASAQILAAKESARAEVAAVNERRGEQMRALCRFLLESEISLQLPAADWTKVADLAGLTWGEFLSLSPKVATNAKQRRMTTRRARFAATLNEDTSLIGAPGAANRSTVTEDGGAW